MSRRTSMLALPGQVSISLMEFANDSYNDAGRELWSGNSVTNQTRGASATRSKELSSPYSYPEAPSKTVKCLFPDCLRR
jgi:hypothetical protein